MTAMIVIPAENALLDLDEAKAYLGISDTDQDDVIQDCINQASEYCEQWVRHPLHARTYSDLPVEPQYTGDLWPPATPIDTGAPIAITINGVAQTVWTPGTPGDRRTYDVQILPASLGGSPSFFRRRDGWHGSILLSCTCGYAELPGDLDRAVKMVVGTFYRLQTKGLTDVVAFNSNVGGGATFAPELVGSLVPMLAKQILDAHTWR